MYNAHQVRSKTRTAVKRREDIVEQDEIEGGEINLIPYLDIVTNLMLFLLASISAGLILGQINTTLPDHRSDAASVVNPDKKPDEQLQIVVSVTNKSILVWSVSGLEGTLQQPAAEMARVPSTKGAAPRYEYWKLNDKLYEIASRRWKGRTRPCDSYEIILMADGQIPYETIIDVMDNLRRRLPREFDHREKMAAATTPRDADPKDGQCKDPVEKYDPDAHLLFPDILFSPGFE